MSLLLSRCVFKISNFRKHVSHMLSSLLISFLLFFNNVSILSTIFHLKLSIGFSTEDVLLLQHKFFSVNFTNLLLHLLLLKFLTVVFVREIYVFEF